MKQRAKSPFEKFELIRNLECKLYPLIKFRHIIYAFPQIHYRREDLSDPEDHLNHLLPLRRHLGVVRGGGEDGDGVSRTYWTATVGASWL